MRKTASLMAGIIAVTALCTAYGTSALRSQGVLAQSLTVEIQGAPPEVFVVLALPPGYEGVGPQGLTSAQLAELSRRLTSVARDGAVSCVRTSAALMTSGGSVTKPAVPYVAVSADVFEILGYTPADGRFFTVEEELAGAEVCVVGNLRPEIPGASHVDPPGGMDTPYRAVGRMPLLSGSPYPLPRIWGSVWVARDGTPRHNQVVWTPITARTPLAYREGDPAEMSESWLVPLVSPYAGQSEVARDIVEKYFGEVWPGASLDFGLSGSGAVILENARAQITLYGDLTFTLMLGMCLAIVVGFMVLLVGHRRRAMSLERALGRDRVSLLVATTALAGALALAGLVVGGMLSLTQAGGGSHEQLFAGASLLLLSRLTVTGGVIMAAGCLAGFGTALWATGPPPIHGLRQAHVVRGRRAFDFRLPIAALAIGLGAAALVFILVSSRSSVSALSAYLQSVGERVILVEQDVFSADAPLQLEDILGPDHADALREELPGWQVVSVTVASTMLTRPDGATQPVTAYGLDDFQPAEAGLGLAEVWAGQDPSDAQGQPVVYLGSRLAEVLFGDDVPLGRELAMGGNRLPVVVGGVLDPRPAGVPDRLGDRDHSLFVSREFLEKVATLVPPAAITEIWAYLPPGADKDHSLARVRSVVDGRWGSRTGLTVEALVDQVSRLSRLERDMARQRVALAGAAMLAAGWLVILVLLARLADRRREFGLRRAVGAPRWRVGADVLAEAGWVCLAGGLAGSALGLALATWYCRTLGWPVVSGTRAALEVLVVATTLCALVAAWPAHQAMGDQPMRALREGGE